MKIIYDSNNFIKELISDNVSHILHDGENIVTIPNNDPSLVNCCGRILDPVYSLPLKKYVNNEIVDVVNSSEYQVDERLWRLYLQKEKDYLYDLVKKGENQKLKNLYDAGDALKKQLITDVIECFWMGSLGDYRIKIGLELMNRVQFEVEYIERVEERALTTEEETAYHGLLTQFHNTNWLLELPLKNTSWYYSYLTWLLSEANNVRVNKAMPQRFEVAGY